MAYDQKSTNALKNFADSDYMTESLESTGTESLELIDTMKVVRYGNGFVEVRYLWPFI